MEKLDLSYFANGNAKYSHFGKWFGSFFENVSGGSLTLESKMHFPYNPATTSPWHLSLRNENYDHTKTYMQNVYRSFICNSSKVETIQMSSNR